MDGVVATLSVEEAAKILGIGRNVAYDLVHEGKIPHLRLGRQIRIPKIALQRMLEEPAP